MSPIIFAVKAIGHHLADRVLGRGQARLLFAGQWFGLKEAGHHAGKLVHSILRGNSRFRLRCVVLRKYRIRDCQ